MDSNLIEVELIPKIAFIPLEVVSGQQGKQLLLERTGAMMFFLAGNVVLDRV
jgi:hypothetical protein